MPGSFGTGALSGAVDLSYMITNAGAAEGSPEWWRDGLGMQLNQRRPVTRKEDNYYEGEHPLFFATAKYAEAFGELFKPFADNWCEVVVDACAERLAVQGFRVGKDAEETDTDAWDMWQRSGMEAESGVAHTESIKHGESYVIVEPTPDGPRYTVEHPEQVIVAVDPGDRRKRLAALKTWQDLYGYIYATVYLPDAAYRYRTAKPSDFGASATDWVERDGYARVGYERVFGGEIPVVPILNSPGLLRGGRSDLTKVMPLQDAVNKLATDLIVASEFAAFRQRLLTGIEVPRFPEGHAQAGEPMNEAFLTSVSRLMVVEDADAKVQEFSASDLTNYVKAVEMFVQHIAAQTRTPPHYLVGQVVNVSGDALKAAETGLVSKARGKSKFMGQGWVDVTRLGFMAKGEAAKAKEVSIEVVWADMENRSEAEVADAAVKAQLLGVPDEMAWERLGYTPVQIKRMKKLRAAQLAEMAALALGGTRPLDQNGDPLPAVTDTGNPAGGDVVAGTAGAPAKGA